MNLSDALTSNAGHAFLVEASPESSNEIVSEIERACGMRFAGNQDARVYQFDQFTVEEARTIAAAATSKAYGERRYIVLVIRHATSEAQNALLKLIEDPQSATLYVIVVPRASILLPTVRSRLIAVHSEFDATSTPEASGFLYASLRDRLDTIAAIQKSKDAAAAATLLDTTEAALSKMNKSDPQVRAALHAVWNVRKVSGGSILKIPLERLALEVPVLKK